MAGRLFHGSEKEEKQGKESKLPNPGKKKRTHQKHVRIQFSKVAARPGLEPRLNEPESLVLPLHQRAVNEILI